MILIVFWWWFSRTVFLKKSCFPSVGKSHLWTLYLRMLRKVLWQKTTVWLVFFLLLLNLMTALRKVGFFLISSKTFHSMGDFLSVASDRIIMVLIDAGLLELQNLIYPELLTGFGTQVFITNSCLFKFQIRYLILYHYF